MAPPARLELTTLRLGVLFYRKSGVKNAIFLDFRAFYALKCVYFEAFCSFLQVIFAFNTNFNTKNYTKTIPILIPVQPYTPMAASCRILYAFRLYLIISQIARKIRLRISLNTLIFLAICDIIRYKRNVYNIRQLAAIGV